MIILYNNNFVVGVNDEFDVAGHSSEEIDNDNKYDDDNNDDSDGDNGRDG